MLYRDLNYESITKLTDEEFKTCQSSCNFELPIRESLLISKYKPSLNKNISSVPVSLL